MLRVERTREEAILKEMSGPIAAGIEVVRVAAMRTAQGHGQRSRFLRHGHQVQVVRHQAVGQHTQTSRFGRACQQFQVHVAIRVCKEDALLVRSSLCDVVRQTGGYRTC